MDSSLSFLGQYPCCLFMVLGDTSMEFEDEPMDLLFLMLHILSIPPAWWMAPINQASPLVPH